MITTIFGIHITCADCVVNSRRKANFFWVITCKQIPMSRLSSPSLSWPISWCWSIPWMDMTSRYIYEYEPSENPRRTDSKYYRVLLVHVIQSRMFALCFFLQSLDKFLYILFYTCFDVWNIWAQWCWSKNSWNGSLPQLPYYTQITQRLSRNVKSNQTVSFCVMVRIYRP